MCTEDYACVLCTHILDVFVLRPSRYFRQIGGGRWPHWVFHPMGLFTGFFDPFVFIHPPDCVIRSIYTDEHGNPLIPYPRHHLFSFFFLIDIINVRSFRGFRKAERDHIIIIRGFNNSSSTM